MNLLVRMDAGPRPAASSLTGGSGDPPMRQRGMRMRSYRVPYMRSPASPSPGTM